MEELKPLEGEPEGYTVIPNPDGFTNNILFGNTFILHHCIR